MKIPLGNLYFMLLYVWDALEAKDNTLVDAEVSYAPVDLLAWILVTQVERLIRVGLHRSYKEERGEILGVRGRINISDSIKSVNIHMGRLKCDCDELSYGSLENRIIRTSLARLAKADGLNSEIADRVRGVERRLAHIEPIAMSARVFEQVSLYRNTKQYKLPIQVCKLLYEQLTPIKSSGKFLFVEFSEERLAALFEEFLRNFYRREQAFYKQVKRERFKWDASSETDDAIGYLPQMETDVSLLSLNERLVIEAKFYEEPLRSKFEASKKTYIPAHLYQMTAYLNNLSAIDGRHSRGVIIYPKVKDDFDFQYRLLAHQVRVATVDLTLSAEALRRRLLTLIKPLNVVSNSS